MTLVPGLKVGLFLSDAELLASLESLLTSAGASPAGVEDTPEAAALEIAEPPGPPGPILGGAAREALAKLPAGARVAVCIRSGLPAAPPAQIAKELGPRLRLVAAECWRAEDGSGVLGGVRRPSLAASERQRLRGLGHALQPTVMVGKQGVSPAVLEGLRAALVRHGLVKARLPAELGAGKDDTADELAWAVGAELVQRVGRMALFYRPDVPLDPPTMKKRT
jgi:RNA-binding protein